jgi:hypothetical protein
LLQFGDPATQAMELFPVVMSKNTHVAGIVSVVGFVNKLDLQVE